MAGNRVDTYEDALYHVKRGFLILGLTGYTGSGCTSVSRLLTKMEKPVLPGSSKVYNNYDDMQVGLIHKKLSRYWNNYKWEAFTSIQVSKVILSFIVIRAIQSRSSDLRIMKIKEIVGERREELGHLKYLVSKNTKYRTKADELINAYEICSDLFIPIKKSFSANLNEFIEIFQNFGDEIRRFGTVFPAKGKKAHPENMFVLPEALRRLIKAYHQAKGKTHFVIDAFRNPYEVEYFKRRYSEFYCVGVLRDALERDNALRNLEPDALKKLKKREDGKIIEKKTKDNISDWVTSQDLDSCLQKADVYIVNDNDDSRRFARLKFNVIKLITLAGNPGCIPPTDVERCMQVAMTARQMSGCISRQVGAVVAGKNHIIHGIGWNDSPHGLPSCSMRTGKDLVDDQDATLFSDYELSKDFVDYIEEHHYFDTPFCFKSALPFVLEGERRAMNEFTRALHAEENAMLISLKNSNGSLEGATLYTTDKTCTLCAKKAFQLGIKKIIYIDDYPGVAIDQTIKAGQRDVEVIRFEGITGAAYFKLFTTLLPEKDLSQLYR